MNKACNDPKCYNFDSTCIIFCSSCLMVAVRGMTFDDLYDMFVEGDNLFQQSKIKGEKYGMMTEKGRRAIEKQQDKWFDVMNKLMLTKL